MKSFHFHEASGRAHLTRCIRLAFTIGAFAFCVGQSCTSLALSESTDDLEYLEQEAFKAAVRSAADSVVQIQTIGGLDRVDDQTLNSGPATGVVVSDDGYIVSSAYHFASRPSSILVRLPSGKLQPAELVGGDESRMLTLLKVDVEQTLDACRPAPLEEVRVGQWAISVGRAFQADRVSVSVGIVSGLGRKHGRVLQTDANVSAANYGGPLLDIEGNTLGVLVPMSPQSSGAEGESPVAGAEFYDSGIGFAVPLQHILDVLPRWIQQRELRRGILGIGLKQGSPYATEPVVESVWPNSPAAAAQWRPGDRIVAVEDIEVTTQNQLRLQMAPRYAGDVVRVRLRRATGDQSEDIETSVTLSGQLDPYRHAFLGVLPMRTTLGTSDDEDRPVAGIAVREVWPDSPAANAGLQPGDRLLSIGDVELGSIDDAFAQLRAANVSDQLRLTVDREGQRLHPTAEVAPLTGDLFPDQDLPLAFATADEREQAEAVEAEELRLPDFPQSAWGFNFSSDGPQGLIVWLGDSDRLAAESLAEQWKAVCRRDRLALVVASPASSDGWLAEDMAFVKRLRQTAGRRYSADPRRTVVGGVGKAGQLACALALGVDEFAGVFSVDGPLPRTVSVRQNRPGRRISFLAIKSPESPFAALMRRDFQTLLEAGYPVALESCAADRQSEQRLDASALSIIARWIDGLDRL